MYFNLPVFHDLEIEIYLLCYNYYQKWKFTLLPIEKNSSILTFEFSKIKDSFSILKMTPHFFSNQNDFRTWLEANHQTEKQLLVGFHKVGKGKPCMTWSESVDQALCFGWIDGIRKSLGPDAYTIRFSPRKPNSVWSPVNIKKVEELTKAGLMREPGLHIFNIRKEDSSKLYSYEMNNMELRPEFQEAFQSNTKAWAYFQSQTKAYRKVAIKWVMTAKQEATIQKRMQTLVSDCEAEQKIKQQRY